MQPETKFGAWPINTKDDEADKARADAIADALGELAGKRLDRPTALSIGKLFQKSLVGRPTWIGEGQSVATLRKFTGHRENTYRVEESTFGQNSVAPTGNNNSAAEPGREHSPHSPHSPGRRAGNGDAGKEGKDGKVSATPAGSNVNSSDATGGTAGWSGRI